MGADGCEGARSAKAHGATVFAQDEATSIVGNWMPAAVAHVGLADKVLPLPKIADAIARWARRRRRAPRGLIAEHTETTPAPYGIRPPRPISHPTSREPAWALASDLPDAPWKEPSLQSSLAAYYRLNDANMALRREFVDLSKKDVAILQRLAGGRRRPHHGSPSGSTTTSSPSVRRRSFSPAGRAPTGRNDLAKFREALERTQAEYLRDMFREAASGGEFGPAFDQKRLLVGKRHNIMHLPLKWYLGSYTLYQTLVRDELKRAYRLRGGFRAKAEKAIFTVFNFDMQAVCDAFFFDAMEGAGLDLTGFELTEKRHDLSDEYEQLLGALRDTLVETVKVSRHLTELSGQLDGAASQSGGAVTQVAHTIQQVALGASEQARAASTTAEAAEELVTVIAGRRARRP